MQTHSLSDKKALLKTKLLKQKREKAEMRSRFKGSFLGKRLSSLNLRYESINEKGYGFFETPISEYDGAWVVAGNRRYLMMASYSYLDLIGHPAIEEASRAAVEEVGTGTHGVRLLAGTLTLHRELERTIARFKKTEDAVVFSSGYVTNLAAISTLVDKGDVVICDAYDHASIIDGCRISNGEFVYFDHNDMKGLEERLYKAGARGKLVIVDGVFSMDGDIADVPRIIGLCRKYNACLMVDEAHSTGAIGKTGHGIEEHFGLDPDDIDIKMGTLSKAIPAVGGYVAGTNELIQALKSNANGFVFSAAVPPPVAAAGKAAFEVIEKEPERVLKLHGNVERYIAGIKSIGFETLKSETAVVPIICRTEEQAFEMTRICREAGLFVLPVVYPAVPVNLPRLRTTVTSAHSHDDIDFAMEVFEKAGKQTGLI